VAEAVTALAAVSRRRRTASLLYEAILLAAVLWCAGFLYAFVQHASGFAVPRWVYQFYLLLVAGVYFVTQWGKGQTLAMKTWRIRLVSRNGGRIGLGRGVLRYLIACVSVLSLGAGFVWALFDSERQFLHDRIAATRLVSA
jgi:uncharacterized RDD family membrane protein YckC